MVTTEHRMSDWGGHRIHTPSCFIQGSQQPAQKKILTFPDLSMQLFPDFEVPILLSNAERSEAKKTWQTSDLRKKCI